MINLDQLLLFYPNLSQALFAAPSDYGAISQVLTFSSSVTFQPVNVSIMNDDLLEIDEVFTASLTPENAADAFRVNLQPDSAEVTILDDDSE